MVLWRILAKFIIVLETLTICVSVASCERSFSKLKLLKNYLRSQARLNSQAIIPIKYERAKNVTFDDAIYKFANKFGTEKENVKLFTPKPFLTLLPTSLISS